MWVNSLFTDWQVLKIVVQILKLRKIDYPVEKYFPPGFVNLALIKNSQHPYTNQRNYSLFENIKKACQGLKL